MENKFAGYILYYQPYCPFCIRVIQVVNNLKINMEMRDTANSKHRQELMTGGGQTMVPCLKHPDGTWQYESSDIIDFIEKKLG